MESDGRGKRKRSPRRSRLSPTQSRTTSVSTSVILKPIQKLLQHFSLFDTVLPEDGPFDEDWYRDTLDAARSDTLQELRLAARMLRRMVPKYSGFVEETLSALFHLTSCRPLYRTRREDALCRPTRCDAWHTMKSLLGTESLDKPQAQRLSRHLLRELNETHLTVVGSRSGGHERTPHEVEHGLLLSVMDAAFRRYPREMLESCFDAWIGADHTANVSPGIFFEQLLLRMPHPGEPTLAHEVFRNNSAALQWTIKAVNTIMQEQRQSGETGFLHHIFALRDAVVQVEQTERRRDDRDRSIHRIGSGTPRVIQIPRRTMSEDVDRSRRRETISELPSRDSDSSIRRSHHSHSYPKESRPLPSTRGSLHGQDDLPPEPSTSTPISRGSNGLSEKMKIVHQSPIVWFALSPPLSKRHLSERFSEYGHVQDIIIPPGAIDHALVVFSSPQEAMRCCDAMKSKGDGTAGRLRCSPVPAAGFSDRGVHVSPFIWVGGPPSVEYESEITARLRSSGKAFPRHLLRVQGRIHGFLVELQSLESVRSAMQCLHSLCSKFVKAAGHESSRKRSRLNASQSCTDGRSKNHRVSGESSTDGKSSSFSKPTDSSEQTDPRTSGNEGTSAINHSDAVQLPDTAQRHQESPMSLIELPDDIPTGAETSVSVKEHPECPKDIQEALLEREWNGELYLRDTFVCCLHGQFLHPLPTRLHLRSKVSLKEVIRAFRGLPVTSRKQHLIRLHPHPNLGQFGKLKAMLMDTASAGVILTDNGPAYLIPSCTAIHQALDLTDTTTDILFCFYVNSNI